MRIPLTIDGLPELASLSSEERRDLLDACDAPGPLRLWSYNFSRGIFLAALLFLLLHLNGFAQQLTGMLGAAVMIAATVLFAYAMHVLTMIRIRGQFRIAMEAANRGGLVPVCLACGHDCSATDSDRCPECGASRRVDVDEGMSE